jgi:hypothetical protein
MRLLPAVALGTVVGATNELPLTKVVNMLKAMQDEVEADLKKDEDMRKKMECWCETNTAEKTQAVEDAKSKIEQLESRIQGAAARKGSAGATLENLDKELSEARAALKQAVEIRDKNAAAFHDSEKGMIQSVELLKGAIITLSKHDPAMLQSDSSFQPLKAKLRAVVHQNLNILDWLSASPARDHFLHFIDAQPDLLEPDTAAFSFLQLRSGRKTSASYYPSYASKSGPILGVLKQMKDDFEKDLLEIQKKETQEATDFSELKGSKEAEIKQMEAQKKSKNEEHAGTRLQLVADKDDLKDTQASMDADTQFLLEIQKTCTNADAEWETRKKARTDEIAALSEAIKILSEDDIRDAQQTTFGFIQLAQAHSPESNQLARALKALRQSAPHNPDVAALIELANKDPFAKVNEAIDKLVAKLKVQQSDEVKQKDYCVNALNENERVTAAKNADLSRLQSDIEELNTQHDTLNQEVSELKTEIKEMQVELQRAAENRKAENLMYQTAVQGQQRTQEALAAAYERLQKFYEKKSLLQISKGSGPAPEAPPDMGDAEPQKNEGATGVMGLMKKLQGEAKVLEDDTINDEQNAQKAYEAMISDTNDSIKQKSRLITDKTEEIARVDEERHQKKLDEESVTADLEGLSQEKADLGGQCNFLLKNFDARQESRAAEMDALAEVKAILGGMHA